MAPRAFWTGHLRLSLVNIPVKLYPATTSERRLEFHQIHQPTGKRIRYQKVVPGAGPVPLWRPRGSTGLFDGLPGQRISSSASFVA